MNGSTPQQSIASGLVDDENPWPGLASFREEDQDHFHGRDDETAALARRVLRERLTLLIGRSGLGKTSLLQAGLFPVLRSTHLLPVYVRLDYSPRSPLLVDQIRQAVTLQALAADVEAPMPQAGESLWEYFHRRDADFWNPRNRVVIPVIAIDQFEEIFTLGRQDVATETFIAELASLVGGHPPQPVVARFDEAPDEASAFVFDRHPYRVLLAMREDFLGELESLRSRMPEVAHNRLRLVPMSGQTAHRVVTHARDVVSVEVAESIVRFVAAEHSRDATMPINDLVVEPTLLSVICRELNNQRLARREKRITAELLEGTHRGILKDFYEESVNNLSPGVRSFVEEKLLTVSGHRDSIALENALALPGVDLGAIRQLEDRRLVRIEERSGVRRVELTHDVLTSVIEKERRDRQSREAKALADAETSRARRKLRRSRIAVGAFGLLTLAAAATSAWALYQQNIVEQTLEALSESKLAAAQANSKNHPEDDDRQTALFDARIALGTLRQDRYGELDKDALGLFDRARKQAEERAGSASNPLWMENASRAIFHVARAKYRAGDLDAAAREAVKSLGGFAKKERIPEQALVFFRALATEKALGEPLRAELQSALSGASRGASATAISVRGRVETQAAGKKDWRELGEGSVLAADARVRTSRESSVELQFVDGTRMTLGPSSEVSLKGLQRRESYRITTPVATIGIRG